MSSYTPAEIRNMIDDFDALVREAVGKGNIKDVFPKERDTLDKIYRIRKQTGLNEAVKNEFQVERFVWVFAQNWRKAKKENGLDNYWDGLGKMMENYDQENPTGRRMFSTTTTNIAANVTSATSKVASATANVTSTTPKVTLATANVTSATTKVASATDNRSSANMNEPANNKKTSATNLQAIDHHSLNPPPSTSKSISPIAQYTPLFRSSEIEDFSVIGEPITVRRNLLSNELKPTRPHYLPLNFQSSANSLLLSNRPGYKETPGRTRSKSPTPGPSRPRVLIKTTSRRSSTISSLSTPRDPSPPSDYNPKMIKPVWPAAKPVAYDSDDDPEYLPSIKVKHIGNKGKEREEAPKQEETGTKRKRKPPQATGDVNDKPCKRCVEKNLTCFSQSGGNACLNCAKVKLKCEDGQYKRQKRTMKPADEKKASAIPPKASAIPPKSSAIPPKSTTGIPAARPAPPAPDAKPRTRARKPTVPTSGTREERQMYTSEQKGKQREKIDDRFEDLKQEVDRLRKLVDSVVPAYIRLSETTADLEKDFRRMKTEFEETTTHQERFLNVLNDRYHKMMDKFDSLGNSSDDSDSMPMPRPIPVKKRMRFKRDGVWVNDWLAMEPDYIEKEEREKKAAEDHDIQSGDEFNEDVLDVKKVAETEGKVADADEDVNEIVVEGVADKKKVAEEKKVAEGDIRIVAGDEIEVVEEGKVADAEVTKVAEEEREVVEGVAGREVADAIVADNNIVLSVATMEEQVATEEQVAMEEQVVDNTQVPPSPSSAHLQPIEMPPPLPPSTPTVTLQPPTPQTSQEGQTTVPTTLLEAPIQNTTREDITKSRSRSMSVAVEDRRRSPRLHARSLSPLPSSLPVKRPPDAAEEIPEAKRARRK